MEDNENINNDNLMNSSMFSGDAGDDGGFDSIFAETPANNDSLDETSSMFEDTPKNEEETIEEAPPTVSEEKTEEIKDTFEEDFNPAKAEEPQTQNKEEEKPPIQVIDEGDDNEENITTEKPTDVVTVRPVKFKKFEETPPIRTIKKNLDIMQDVSMHVSVELGRTKSSIKEVMDFKEGSIVELNKIAGEQVEVFVNGKLVAKGEVIVIEDRFGVRITSTNVSKTAIP